MLLSMHIIADYFKKSEIDHHITTNELNILTTRLYDPDQEMKDNTVYIGTEKEIWGNGSDHIVLIHQDEWILLSITSIEQVANRLLNLIESFSAWSSDMLEMVASSSMIQDIVDGSADLLQMPFFLVDSGQRLLAINHQFPLGSVDAIWDEMLLHGAANMAFLSQIHQRIPTSYGDQDLHYYDDPCLPHAIYLKTFFVKKNQVGQACLIDINSDITPGELLVFQSMCNFLDKWFHSNIQIHEQLQLQLLLQSAITNPEENNEELVWQLQLQGWRDGDSLVMLKLDAPYEPYNINEHLCRSINSRFAYLLAAPVDYSIAILCNLKDVSLDSLRKTLEPLLHSSKYYGAHSRVFNLRDSFHDNYELAQIASEHCDKKVGQLYDGEQFVHYYLLKEMHQMISPEHLHPALKQLKQYDTTHHSDLYHTLRVYLQMERSPSATAKVLQIHRNSLSYRLEKIKELLSLDLDNVNTRLYLSLSFAIDDF